MKFAALILFSSLIGRAELFEIVPQPSSRFSLEIYKTGLMNGKKHILLFGKFHGSLDYDPQLPQRSKVDFRVDASDFRVLDDWIDAAKRNEVREYALGKNGLEVARHPSIHFVSTSIARRGDGDVDVRGELTIRGIARPAFIQVKLSVKGEALEFAGRSIVNLKDYGIKPPSAVLGAVGTKPEMLVEFSIAAVRR